MGKALYRKYRSRSLDEIVGQEHITETLKHALKTGKISHAYLLTGPRGTGKTSIARIIAHEINELKYSEDSNFDIIEIDAASNNGVEDVRDLREKVQSAPTSAKYKVYIIDEVHMLSKAAFNALLKTLEEPPAHVIFILATTEVHKLPETIISRTQRFSLRPVPLDKVTAHLKTIAETEKIDIDDEALSLIAEHGEGSFRDSISLLDQARSLGDKITKIHIENLLGRAPGQLIDSLLHHVETRDSLSIARDLQDLYDHGHEAGIIASQLSKMIRENLLSSTPKLPATEMIDILKKLIDVPASPRPSQLLELVLLSHAMSGSGKQLTESKSSPLRLVEQSSSQLVQTESQPSGPLKVQDAKKDSKSKNDVQDTLSSNITPPSSNSTAKDGTTSSALSSSNSNNEKTLLDEDSTEMLEEAITQYGPAKEFATIEDLWTEVLQTIKQTHNTLYGIARMVKPALSNDILTLTTKFSFHQKRLNEVKNKNILIKCVSELRGKPTNVNCEVKSDTAAMSTDSISNDLSTISNIFGGAELL